MGEPRGSFGAVLRAATDKTGLAVLGASVVGAGALHSLPLLAIGGLAYLAVVAWDLVGGAPDVAKGPGPVPLPDPAGFADAACRGTILALGRARGELAKVVADTPPSVLGIVAPALGRVRELEQHALALLTRAEDLNDYLRTQDPKALRAELERLAGLAKGARDASARDEYERARAQRVEQLGALDDITAAKDRVHANLARIVATLEGLPPRLVRMRALDAQALDALGDDVSHDLDHLASEIRLFETTLQSLANGSPP